MSYTKEGYLFICGQLYGDLLSVGAVKAGDIENENLLVMTDTFKMCIDKSFEQPDDIERLCSRAAEFIYRTLEMQNLTFNISEESRGAIVEYIQYVLQSKCKSAHRAKKLLDKCKEIMKEKEEG